MLQALVLFFMISMNSMVNHFCIRKYAHIQELFA
jgi:hypothetical protein